MTNKDALRQAYKILSPYSDKQLWEFNNNLVHLNFLTKRLPRDKTIFDAGCGIGILALALNILGYQVEGVDKYLFQAGSGFAVGEVEKLQEIWRRHNLSVSNKNILTDATGEQYDAVISIATIEHQTDPRAFLNGLKRILKSDGHLYIATPNISHLLNRVRFIFGRSPLSAHLPEYFQQGEKFTGHWREYTLEELWQMLIWAGFEIIEEKNVQSMRPQFNLAGLPREFCRLLAYVLPGARDTNIIFARRKD